MRQPNWENENLTAVSYTIGFLSFPPGWVTHAWWTHGWWWCCWWAWVPWWCFSTSTWQQKWPTSTPQCTHTVNISPHYYVFGYSALCVIWKQKCAVLHSIRLITVYLLGKLLVVYIWKSCQTCHYNIISGCKQYFIIQAGSIWTDERTNIQ